MGWPGLGEVNWNFGSLSTLLELRVGIQGEMLWPFKSASHTVRPSDNIIELFQHLYSGLAPYVEV